MTSPLGRDGEMCVKQFVNSMNTNLIYYFEVKQSKYVMISLIKHFYMSTFCEEESKSAKT